MIAVDGKPVSHKFSEAERDHAGKINFLVTEVLEEAELSIHELDAIAVCNGPGSYTGLRIGLATAKGFCYALGKQLILHNRLTLMLQELRKQMGNKEMNALAILPARAGEYYVAAAGEYHSAPKHVTTSELLENTAVCRKPFAVIGNYSEDLSPIEIAYHIEHQTLNMEVWSSATHEAFLNGQFADLAYAEPEYLKPAYIVAPRADR